MKEKIKDDSPALQKIKSFNYNINNIVKIHDLEYEVYIIKASVQY